MKKSFLFLLSFFFVSLPVCQAQDAPAVAPKEALIGTWRVDLRTSRNADPNFTELMIESIEDKMLTGSFYYTNVEDGLINDTWGTVYLAFTTEDGSGPYQTSARLENGKLIGTTHSLGRGFLSVWTAEKIK